jgi:hypothetical protein
MTRGRLSTLAALGVTRVGREQRPLMNVNEHERRRFRFTFIHVH